MAALPSKDFVALGHSGVENYAGLETFPNPGVSHVEMESDELTAVCPITGQPDMYVATIEYSPEALCLESKSLKLYLMRFRNEGVFCEALAVKIRDDVAATLQLGQELVTVTLVQKAARRDHDHRDRVEPKLLLGSSRRLRVARGRPPRRAELLQSATLAQEIPVPVERTLTAASRWRSASVASPCDSRSQNAVLLGDELFDVAVDLIIVHRGSD